jgi:geranylgeranyl diphosphate synthase, type II
MSQNSFGTNKIINATEAVEVYLEDYLSLRASDVEALSPQLLKAMKYSLFSGGKRFRPTLALTVSSKAIAWAAAVEMIHTYSLIHDDLPCMDNDDERRGQPTNHKKFGEPLALLAGDALLTESFLLIAKAYAETPDIAQRLTALLARSAGASGMVGGQAMDMQIGQPLADVEAVLKVHTNKTAELIAAAIEGAAIVAGEPPELCGKLRALGLNLGLCFQIKDDLLDGVQDQTAKSLLFFMSEKKLTEILNQKTEEGLSELEKLPLGAHELRPFFHYNLTRMK